MSENTERDRRVIELMERQSLRLRMAEQLVKAAGDAPRSDVVRALAAVLYAWMLPTAGGIEAADRIGAATGSAEFSGADPDDVIAALVQALHDRTALRMTDAYHQPPASQRTGCAAPILSAEEASQRAAERGIAPAADFEE